MQGKGISPNKYLLGHGVRLGQQLGVHALIRCRHCRCHLDVLCGQGNWHQRPPRRSCVGRGWCSGVHCRGCVCRRRRGGGKLCRCRAATCMRLSSRWACRCGRLRQRRCGRQRRLLNDRCSCWRWCRRPDRPVELQHLQQARHDVHVLNVRLHTNVLVLRGRRLIPAARACWQITGHIESI